MICVGYMGVESFDIILYVGNTISTLGYPLLIIDLSNTDALTKAIYHGMELDSSDTIVHYRNLNYTRKILDENELREFNSGVLLIVYGFNNIDSYPYQLDQLHTIVNPYSHNIDKVNKALSNSSLEDVNVSVLVRDIVTIDDFDRAKGLMISSLSPCETMYLFHDINDYENAFICQASQLVRVRKISSGMKKIIISDTGRILPYIKPSIIRKALCKARRGEKCR